MTPTRRKTLHLTTPKRTTNGRWGCWRRKKKESKSNSKISTKKSPPSSTTSPPSGMTPNTPKNSTNSAMKVPIPSCRSKGVQTLRVNLQRSQDFGLWGNWKTQSVASQQIQNIEPASKNDLSWWLHYQPRGTQNSLQKGNSRVSRNAEIVHRNQGENEQALWV